MLDTNTCIQCLRPKGNALVKARVAARSTADLALSTVSVVELVFGAARSTHPAAGHAQTAAFVRRYTLLPVDEVVADLAGTTRADLASQGLLIGPYDLLIAATALTHSLILVTHNTREFSRVAGLSLEDWELP
ncbi:MAG: PIN domain-containing protein [Gemmataceae bacterium]|nr:PIN domain-containing protein [Gemmataceae bacterium]